MKVQVRRGVFETNSSSVHSITMCSKEDYKRWENGELFLKRYGDKLVDVNDSKVAKERADYEAELEEWEKDENHNRWDKPYAELLTYNEFNDWNFIDYDTFYEEYKTPSGDTIVAFGYYGHD